MALKPEQTYSPIGCNRDPSKDGQLIFNNDAHSIQWKQIFFIEHTKKNTIKNDMPGLSKFKLLFFEIYH